MELVNPFNKYSKFERKVFWTSSWWGGAVGVHKSQVIDMLRSPHINPATMKLPLHGSTVCIHLKTNPAEVVYISCTIEQTALKRKRLFAVHSFFLVHLLTRRGHFVY